MAARRLCGGGALHQNGLLGTRNAAAFTTHPPAVDARAWQTFAALRLVGTTSPCRSAGAGRRTVGAATWRPATSRLQSGRSAPRPVRSAGASNPDAAHAHASARLLCVRALTASLRTVAVAGRRRAVRRAGHGRALQRRQQGRCGACRRLNPLAQPRGAARRAPPPALR